MAQSNSYKLSNNNPVRRAATNAALHVMPPPYKDANLTRKQEEAQASLLAQASR